MWLSIKWSQPWFLFVLSPLLKNQHLTQHAGDDRERIPPLKETQQTIKAQKRWVKSESEGLPYTSEWQNGSSIPEAASHTVNLAALNLRSRFDSHHEVNIWTSEATSAIGARDHLQNLHFSQLWAISSIFYEYDQFRCNRSILENLVFVGKISENTKRPMKSKHQFVTDLAFYSCSERSPHLPVS